MQRTSHRVSATKRSQVERLRISGVQPSSFRVRRAPNGDPSDAIKLDGTPRRKRKKRWKPKPPSEFKQARMDSLRAIVRYSNALRKQQTKLNREAAVVQYVIGLLTGRIEPTT